jgi:hypothetical protein
MNKLPAAAPVGVGIAAGASQLNKKPGMKNGGLQNAYNKIKKSYGKIK